ncbi:stellacyanin [Ricinus communis]|uniref:Blue copper protein, putative n=1 Tax=Ricinus communis TaxID=3988 RepID=B9SMH1_RICCO|nr:stellacyanin [Ricinus communis]EEF35203.1 Blue copper protein precursor, putative [Ricinus communis]|eukprot:XP_002527190.1 stellacyanin [Ricinus communis]
MAGSRMMGLVGFLVVAVGLLQGANAATKYTVGDSLGWTVPPSNSVGFYEDWANNRTFQIGDSLVFNWTGTHTATEVASEEEYNNCTKTGIVITTSGVNVLLSANGTRYFVCSVATNCEQGMKVAIRVGNGVPPPPLPPSAAPSLTIGSLTAVLSSILILFFSYM